MYHVVIIDKKRKITFRHIYDFILKIAGDSLNRPENAPKLAS
jgi:hypothetical protein